MSNVLGRKHLSFVLYKCELKFCQQRRTILLLPESSLNQPQSIYIVGNGCLECTQTASFLSICSAAEQSWKRAQELLYVFNLYLNSSSYGVAGVQMHCGELSDAIKLESYLQRFSSV